MSAVTAYAPGSVTALFAPPAAEAPRSEARGASVAVADGVAATVRPADGTTVRLDGEPTEFAPVEGVLGRLEVTALVELAADVPVGCGFGASGAATLATALAADAVFDLGADRAALLEAAHRAEVAAGTGLGDVFIQDRGGLLWSDDGTRTRTEPDDRIEYTAHGGLSTAAVLEDPDRMARIREAGTRALEDLPDPPSVANLLTAGWAFAEATGLVTDRVRATVERVDRAGGVATMAMLGETVVATGVDGVLERSTDVDARGVRIVDP